MRYAILFHDTVVGHSTFEFAYALVGLADGVFEPTAAFEQLRPLLPQPERAPEGADVGATFEFDLDAFAPMQPAVERLPLQVADSEGRLLNARVCGFNTAPDRMRVTAWINDAAYWRSVAAG